MKQDMNPTRLFLKAADRFSRSTGRLWVCLAVLVLAGAVPASAQVAPPPSAGAPPMLPGSIDLPSGAGAGLHGANSPFAPLVDRADVVAWSVLTDVKTKVVKKRMLPAFNTSQLALSDKTQRIQGFMLPLEPGEKHRRFLLSRVPLTCGFCLPGGPESMIEVRTKAAVKYSLEAVVVEGRFLALTDDEYGLYYRLTDAAIVK
jgi:hypothetical protein